MQLSKQLVLFRYILWQLGYTEFEAMREEFHNQQTGTNTTGMSYFASALMAKANKQIDEQLIREYDDAIQGYENKLRQNLAEPDFSLKYYQWLGLFFTEYFFDQSSKRQDAFLRSLNEYLQANSDFNELDSYVASDLKKLAYWMATGSGKTLLMHCNFWQITKYFKHWENIILITPNAGLSRQHDESMQASGIACHIYSGSEASLTTRTDEILIIEITKLVRDKAGDGVSVDVDSFSEDRNLIFIDEGHKGSKSEEQTWKSLREYLARGEGSFTFEYSATFGQVINNQNRFLLNEYAKSIIFDYSYRHFYTDGYGKDFTVFNLDVENDYSKDQRNLLLTASLLGFYEQLILFEKFRDDLRPLNIEKPLWIFVGSKVQGAVNQSDISKVVHFIRYVLSNSIRFQDDISNILNGTSGLRDETGNDIFKHSFEYLKDHPPIPAEILGKVFHGMGSIEALQIKQAEGEIALKTKTSDQYFAVINIGDASKYIKTLEKDTSGEIIIRDDNFTKSLFHTISEPESPINILIGSKKFIEGWNSWRVSSMGLMNMGRSEGAQIIQLFGRGVRLKGRKLSLKREEATAPYHIKALQTIAIMGLNASYMNHFLKNIENEVPDYTEHTIDIKLNHEEKWNGQLITFKPEQGKDFKDELILLEYRVNVARRITIDLRPKVSIAAGGFNSQVAAVAAEYAENFLSHFNDFIDYSKLMLEADRYKHLKGYYNLIINRETLEKLLNDGAFKLLSQREQFGLEEVIFGKIQNIATSIVKDYLSKFYADQEKNFLSKHLSYEMLKHPEHELMFPANQKLIVRIPQQHIGIIAELEAALQQMYQQDNTVLPTIHFDKHLYSPIASIANGHRFEEVKTIPVRLNEGEGDFLRHLREYVKVSKHFEGKEVFILRNPSVAGLGFFMESSSFYPDFIVWVVVGNTQFIYFLDPKGILHGETNFNNPKVLWCKHDTPAIEKSIQVRLKKNKSQFSVSISSYILSITSIDEAMKTWSDGNAGRQEFKDNHILFIEENKEYLTQIFEDIATA